MDDGKAFKVAGAACGPVLDSLLAASPILPVESRPNFRVMEEDISEHTIHFENDEYQISYLQFCGHGIAYLQPIS